MELDILTAISPADGRYRKQTEVLSAYFSEFALIKFRLQVEIEYFIALTKIPLPSLKSFPGNGEEIMREWVANFNSDQAIAIKNIEATTNHDVKAVEYFLRNKFEVCGWNQYVEFIHFGLTSQDVNNTAIPMAYKKSLEEIIVPTYQQLWHSLKELAAQWKNIPMLARTHGQAASPTTVGKEFMVFAERIAVQLTHLKNIPVSGKFGGATGNFNAHHVAYPQVDWVKFSNDFLTQKLGIQRQQVTTQIEHYDELAASFDNLRRLNTICVDLCRDCWSYISLDYFKQKLKEGEVGSSAMPHKVNPIDFENAEGNFLYGSAILTFLSEKLPISRLQRDLTDSTVLRNIGMPLAHTIIALNSLDKGLNKLLLHPETIANDLEENWAVVAEAVQTILRRENYPHPYQALKNLTRQHSKITRSDIEKFIDDLLVSDAVKTELKQITPQNYIGIDLVKTSLQQINFRIT